ncbi:PiggyBac transposable element-derived protein 4 [Plakobranchus ocellatus]|uniref:PiggyBac transposable element-derived protein 4 n=1 Tax=Plakobranchus ocellatus TaxID=259542 RepID=A0AAV4C035_9GAST|nr:PiggyBac transposable element-derived protein 4 [Plakobranchus ocellatus]
MADRNLWEDSMNVDDNESGEDIDSKESGGEMGEPTFHDLQPVTLEGQDASDAEDADSDTSGEEEENVEESSPAPDVWKSKDGTEWRSTPLPSGKTPKKNIVKIPKNTVPFTDSVVSPIDCFSLFFTTTMIEMIVQFTNTEGKRVRGKTWSATDFAEINCLIGCLMYIGARKQNYMDVKCIFDLLEGLQLVRARFSRRRFSDLLTFLRFDDKETRSQRRERDPFAPIRELWDCFQINLGRYYVPGINITVDEQLVAFRGRCSFLQYLPSTPDKYGLKIFWATDPVTNYPLAGVPYLGRTNNRSRATNLGFHTVVELVKKFVGSGRNIITDNFFTSQEFADWLLLNNLTLVGTLKRNKRCLPPQFQQKKHLKLYDNDQTTRQLRQGSSRTTTVSSVLLSLQDQGVAPRHASVSGRFTPTHKHVQQVSPVPAAGFSMTESGLQCPVGAHTDFYDQQGQSCPRRL